MKKMIAIMTVAVLMLTACSSTILDGARKELEDTIADVSDSENRYVRMVKGGYRVGQPELTYGDAFEYFFASPRWKYFIGEDGQDVVEFTGDCMYRDVSVKARIQFIVDEENGTFEPGYLAYNEVPQDVITRSVLIQTVFEKAEQAGIGNIKVNMNAMSSENSENSGTGYLIYKDISLSELLNKSADEVCNILGFPTSGTPVDGEMLYGGTEFYGYDGLALYFDGQPGTVMQIYVQPSMVKINGKTLDKTRTELISFLGQPNYEEYSEGVEGEFDPYYYMQYTVYEAGFLFEIEMSDEDSKAHGVNIYRHEDNWGW